MCGIFGVIGDPHAAHTVLKGLHALQDRGQAACGIASYDLDENEFHERKGAGLVREVFGSSERLSALTGTMALGHTRYPTTGPDTLRNAQPLGTRNGRGIYAVHNGNVYRTDELKARLERHNLSVESTSDLEVLLLNFALNGRLKDKHHLFHAVENLMNDSDPSYSIVMMLQDRGLLAFRDPYGMRPLVWGKKQTDQGYAHAFASETIALRKAGYDIERDILPGEAIFIDQKNCEVTEEKIMDSHVMHCAFEHVYFSRVESILDGQRISKVRRRLGIELDSLVPQYDFDLVAAVPNTGRTAANAFANHRGLKHDEILFKHPQGTPLRTFIEGSQEEREQRVRDKFAVSDDAEGKKILLIDDSIVRSTTIRVLVEMVREAGAVEVHVASTFPEVTHPCFFGIDTPTYEELIAHQRSVDEIKEIINADSLTYMSEVGLQRAIGLGNTLCKGCIGGQNPVPELYQIRRPK